MKVLFVSSECFPLVKTGGLADVTGALPLALADDGIKVNVTLVFSPAQALLAAAPGPDDQPPRCPVGPVPGAPGILKGAAPIRSGGLRLPEGLEIEAEGQGERE